MGVYQRAGIRLGAVLIAAGVAAGLGACGPLQHAASLALSGPGAPDAVPWPPPAARRAADTDSVLFGSEWSQKSDTADGLGYFLVLSGGGALPWAIYSIDGLSAGNELIQADITYSETPLTAGDGTRLFIGLADYERGSWVWHDPGTSPWPLIIAEPARYRSPAGAGHLAVALAGPGTARLDQIAFTTGGDLLAAPANLTAEAVAVKLVQLDWDDVAGAEGYHVYRGTPTAMSTQERITDEPVAASGYEDGPAQSGRYYYYHVTAVAGGESAPSNSAAVWSHEIELPAPQNLRLAGHTEDTLTFAWDWAGAEPDGYYLYLDTAPGFPIIDGETEARWLHGTITDTDVPSYQGQPLEPGVIYFAKICARDDDNRRGRMSNEASGRLGDFWDWSDVQVIADGQPPLRAVRAGAEIAVVFINDYDVLLAVRQDGQWQIDAPLPAVADLLFSDYMDLDYSDGVFLVAAMDRAAGDAWAAWGSPGNWTRERLHGDGDLTPFHIESGFDIICAASADELAVVHLLDQPQPLNPTITLHAMPAAGGPWSESAVRVFDMSQDPYPLAISHCLAYQGGDLCYLCTDGAEDQLYFTSRAAGWDFTGTDVRSGDYRFRTDHDLTRFGGEWCTTAFDGQQAWRGLYLLHGDDSAYPWQQQSITPPSESLGYNARMDAEGDEAIVVYYGLGAYYFALHSTGWAAEQITVPGVADYGSKVEILLSGGEPYFIFQDQDSGEVNIAHGVPPA